MRLITCRVEASEAASHYNFYSNLSSASICGVGRFGTRLRAKLWGVPGQAPRETPCIQHASFRRGNCTCAALCSRASSRAGRSTTIIDRRLAQLAYLSPKLFFKEFWDSPAIQNRVAFRGNANARTD